MSSQWATRGPRNQHTSGPWSESIDIIGKLLPWAKTFGLKSSAVVIFMTNSNAEIPRSQNAAAGVAAW